MIFKFNGFDYLLFHRCFILLNRNVIIHLFYGCFILLNRYVIIHVVFRSRSCPSFTELRCYPTNLSQSNWCSNIVRTPFNMYIPPTLFGDIFNGEFFCDEITQWGNILNCVINANQAFLHIVDVRLLWQKSTLDTISISHKSMASKLIPFSRSIDMSR